VFEYIRDANTAMDAGEFGEENVKSARELLASFDQVVDVLTPELKESGIADGQIETLITERTEAKKARNFSRSDDIRRQLLEAGVILEDTKDGTRWKRT